MLRGNNRADRTYRLIRRVNNVLGESIQDDNKPCVFISHQTADTNHCIKIADYLMDAGIDVYLDTYDKTLEQIAQEGDPDELTKRLEEGIENW